MHSNCWLIGAQYRRVFDDCLILLPVCIASKEVFILSLIAKLIASDELCLMSLEAGNEKDFKKGLFAHEEGYLHSNWVNKTRFLHAHLPSGKLNLLIALMPLMHGDLMSL